MKKLFIILSFLFSTQMLIANGGCPPPPNVVINTNAELNYFLSQYGSCTTIVGDLTIGPDVTSLGGFLLTNLTSITGNLQIDMNEHVGNLNGLSNFNEVGGDLKVTYCNNLESVNGFQSITAVGGDITIADHPDLISFLGLNLAECPGVVEIENNSLLTDISGLLLNGTLVPSAWTIKDNPDLSACDIDPICAFIYDGGSATIQNNSSGCNSQSQVELACACPDAFTINTNDANICAGEETTLSILSDGGWPEVTYYWIPGGITGNSISVSPNSTETYSAMALYEGNSCISEEMTINVENHPSPQITGSVILCPNTVSTLDAGAGFASYNWSTGENTQTIGITEAGVYSVVIETAFGCEGDSQFEVLEWEKPHALITDELCVSKESESSLFAGLSQ